MKKRTEVDANETRVSDLEGRGAAEAYKIMLSYLRDDDLGSEDRYEEMGRSIESLKSYIPEDIYKKICDYVTENLAGFTYNPEKAFPRCYSEQHDRVGKFDENGNWISRSESATFQKNYSFLRDMADHKSRLDLFAMEELGLNIFVEKEEK